MLTLLNAEVSRLGSNCIMLASLRAREGSILSGQQTSWCVEQSQECPRLEQVESSAARAVRKSYKCDKVTNASLDASGHFTIIPGRL